jgi:hypothetical protein
MGSLYKQLTVYEDGKDAECTVGADLPADPLQMDLGLRFGVVVEITIRNTLSDAGAEALNGCVRFADPYTDP